MEDLEQPPVVRLDDSLAASGAAMEPSRWAVVLDADGELAGWIGRDMAAGSGLVRDRARRMEAWVELDDSLKVAFGEMLQWNAGWIAVLDDRNHYLGVLTPATLHAALRRSVEADVQQIEAAEVELETVEDA